MNSIVIEVNRLDIFPLLHRLDHLENHMTKISDAVARNQASTAALLTSIQTEIQQLAQNATDNGDDSLADSLNAQSDQLDIAKGQLDADDPAAPPADGSAKA